ncbi:MAG TPA: hypothetical protein VIV60_30535 [Polyangiaceae bacterium]
MTAIEFSCKLRDWLIKHPEAQDLPIKGYGYHDDDFDEPIIVERNGKFMVLLPNATTPKDKLA